jgi:hypothetical protein
MLLTRGEECPQKILLSHKRHGGKTTMKWGCVDLSDETFPIQIEIPSTCVLCGGELTGVFSTIPEGVICNFCDSDEIWFPEVFNEKRRQLK